MKRLETALERETLAMHFFADCMIRIRKLPHVNSNDLGGIQAAELQLLHIDLGPLLNSSAVTLAPHILGKVLRPSPVEAEIRPEGSWVLRSDQSRSGRIANFVGVCWHHQ